MSDFDDELLELVEAGSDKKQKRKTKTKPSKKRKADLSDYENDPESEEDEEDPYPLEGKYVDAADKHRLMQMSEIEREEIITGRLEDKQRMLDKRAISRMVKDQRSGDMDGVARASKRQRSSRGFTKEKSRKLDELKAKRKAKGDKQHNEGSPFHDGSSSAMDMGTSDEDDEDGQINKSDQEHEREQHPPVKDEPITMDDLEKCHLTRDMIAKYYLSPWFEEYVKNTWVRYLIGCEDGKSIYRICQVINLGADIVKPYMVESTMVNQTIELQHGISKKLWQMDKVSNSPFEPKEFLRLKNTCETEHVKLPSKKELEIKEARMVQLVTQPKTEADVSAILARKSQITAAKSQNWVTLERARLVQQRTLAQRRLDYHEVAELDAKLAEFIAQYGEDLSSPQKNGRRAENDTLAKLSEKNRRANAEAVRRAEIAAAEQRRRERKRALAGKSGTATPTDPSARLKTVPRTFNSATPVSRPATPSGLQPAPLTPERKPSPLVPSTNGKAKTFEASVIETMEVDLGDF
ncbi:plus-3-domain-containing protein [Guyanagaster necrorhizus]|uniref:Plus-3-domain-containing protein n=1 Tax=Guyanagaster necrorhizus TaxID=856835 RepID=A0A9P7W1F4_9AGAR|nr:plus-3-domain-containing protein [Guyanagaster necrorhizus MCA 3950]KAG7451546.1 plus-3-domain-containing protein [Guyanagaster necrorhizus MCA 3950]